MKIQLVTLNSSRKTINVFIMIVLVPKSIQICPENTFIDSMNNCKPCNTLLPHCDICLKNLTCVSCSHPYRLQSSIQSKGQFFQSCVKAYWLTQWWGLIIIGFGSIFIGIVFSVIICIFARFCMHSKKLNKVVSKRGKTGLFRKRKNRKFSMKVEKSRYDFSENIESQVNLREEIENNRLEFKKFKEEVKKTRETNKEFDWNKFRLSIEISHNQNASSKMSDDLRFGNEKIDINLNKLPPISSKTLKNTRFSLNEENQDSKIISRIINNQSPPYSMNRTHCLPQKRLSQFHQNEAKKETFLKNNREIHSMANSPQVTNKFEKSIEGTNQLFKPGKKSI